MDVLDGCGGELPLPPWAMADGCLKGFGGEHACAPIGAPKAMRMALPLPPPAAFPAPPPPSTGGAIVLAPQNPPHQNQAPMGYQYGRQRTPLRPRNRFSPRPLRAAARCLCLPQVPVQLLKR